MRCDYCPNVRELGHYRLGGTDSPVFKVLCPACVARLARVIVLERRA